MDEKISKMPQKTSVEILQNYSGANNYIISLKKKLNTNKKFSLTRAQSLYIKNYHKTIPKVVRRWVDVDGYFANKMMYDMLLPKPPERVYVEKLLVEKDKAYHIWGKFFDSQDIHDFWLPKVALLKQNNREPIEVDYSKYDNRPPLEHQKEAIEKLLVNDKFILADSMGLGKTTSAVIASIESDSKKVLVVCPASLKINWKREIELYSDKPISIIEGKKWSSAEYVIINYDILKNFHNIKDKENSTILNENFDLIIADECFTYNTPIITNSGVIPIGEIVENSLPVKILTYNIEKKDYEYKKILRYLKKETSTLCQIKMQNGLFIECTPNHKFFTINRGYVKAKELKKTDKLCMVQQTINKETNTKKRKILFKKLCYKTQKFIPSAKTKRKEIPQKMPTMRENNVIYNGEKNEQTKILQSAMSRPIYWKKRRNSKKNKKLERYCRLVGMDERNSQKKSPYIKIKFGANEKKQPNEQKRKCGKNEKIIKRKNFFISWRKFTNNRTTKNVTQATWRRLDSRAPNNNCTSTQSIPIITKLLQSRYWKRKEKNSNRSRWENTQTKKMEIFRQKKDRNIEFVRMDSIKILELGCDGGPAKVCGKDKKVYDLEVIDNHNYFANNILVSNCHMVNNPQAQRTKIINDLTNNIDKVWLLTGTPMTSRPINYYNLLKIVDSPVAYNWVAYAIRYCKGYQFTIGNRKIWNVTGASHLDELRERTKPQILRRLKEDVLDLPEKIITPVYLNLHSKEYEELMGEYYDWFENSEEKKSLTVQFSKLMKVRQVIAEEKVQHTIEMAENIIEQDMKVIIFTNFTKSLNMIKDHFGKSAVKLDGKMSKPDRQKSIDEFQNNDKVKVFVGNIIAAGMGITLTAGECVIMNDLSFVPSHHNQAEDRAYRYGQKNNVLVYYPLFQNSIDMIVYNIINRKKQIIETVMGDNEEIGDTVEEILNSINNRQ